MWGNRIIPSSDILKLKSIIHYVTKCSKNVWLKKCDYMFLIGAMLCESTFEYALDMLSYN